MLQFYHSYAPTENGNLSNLKEDNSLLFNRE
jgi:hypothetical protein